MNTNAREKNRKETTKGKDEYFEYSAGREKSFPPM